MKGDNMTQIKQLEDDRTICNVKNIPILNIEDIVLQNKTLDLKMVDILDRLLKENEHLRKENEVLNKEFNRMLNLIETTTFKR